MRFVKFAGVTAVSLSFLSIAGGAKATNTGATMSNSATVTAYCSVSTGNLAFGTYNGSAAASTSAVVSATCTKSTTYTIALDPGTTTGATTAVRLLTNGTDNINYTISKDSSHSQNWGNTVGTDTQAGTGNGAAQTYTAYGNIAAGQFVTPGAYTDTVTVTLTY